MCGPIEVDQRSRSSVLKDIPEDFAVARAVVIVFTCLLMNVLDLGCKWMM